MSPFSKKKQITIKDLFSSFLFALSGLRIMLVSQRHAWIHLVATVVVCITSAIVGINPIEWCWIIIAIVSVWTAEALNTAFEFLCEVASPEFHPLVEKAKNVAAGAVLICAFGAMVIGLIILGPPLLKILKGLS